MGQMEVGFVQVAQHRLAAPSHQVASAALAVIQCDQDAVDGFGQVFHVVFETLWIVFEVLELDVVVMW